MRSAPMISLETCSKCSKASHIRSLGYLVVTWEHTAFQLGSRFHHLLYPKREAKPCFFPT